VIILVADDYETNRKLLSVLLTRQGYRVLEARDGKEALSCLQAAQEPMVALIDWEMPEMPGIEVCREARKLPHSQSLFLVLVTVRDSINDIMSGFGAGVNDFIKKPFDNGELVARVRVAVRMLELEHTLAQRVQELERAHEQIAQLSGLLPMCSFCKKVSDDRNYWQQVVTYITARTGAEISHGYCPECFEKRLKPDMLKLGVSEASLDKLRPPGSGEPPTA
jgi:PleD family two-component response regulator